MRIDVGLLDPHTPLNQEGESDLVSQLAPAPLQPPLGAGGGGFGDREGSNLRCVGNQITEMTLSDFQSSMKELRKTEFLKLTLSYIGSICQRVANFSIGKVLFFPFQPMDVLANI